MTVALTIKTSLRLRVFLAGGMPPLQLGICSSPPSPQSPPPRKIAPSRLLHHQISIPHPPKVNFPHPLNTAD